MLVTNLGLQKVIPLLLLIGVGYLLKDKFQQPTATGAIKNLIINAALPATIFLSILNIDQTLGVFSLPAVAIALNLYLLFIGFWVARLVIEPEEKAQFRSLIVMFPSLAPGLTAYPFIEEFLGSRSLAWASLADVGNKIFTLIGLYILAMYWHQRVSSDSSNYSNQLKTIWLLLISEPSNAAIIFGLPLLFFNISQNDLPDTILDVLTKLAACTTPLILFFVGISFKSKAFKLQTILAILFARAGAGFWFSAGAIALLNPDPITKALTVILPQAGCSMWPYLHITQVNGRGQSSSEKEKPSLPPTFDTEFALGILATSIPFSICVISTICSSSQFFILPEHLGLVGLAFFGMVGLLKLGSNLANQPSENLEIEFAFKIAVKKRPLALSPSTVQPRLISNDKLLTEHNSSSSKEDYGSIEPTEYQLNLQFLALLLQHRLQSEGLLGINLDINFISQDKKLIVEGEHTANESPESSKTFEALKDEIILFLNLDFAIDVNLSLSLLGEKQPYASIYFVINPSN